MDAMLTKKAEELAMEVASQATTLDELNGVMRSLMKSALEKMLSTELEVHLGRVPDALAETIAEAGEATSGADGDDASPRGIERTARVRRRFRETWAGCLWTFPGIATGPSNPS